MFSCFHPITGGRVGAIVSQETKLCGSKGKDSLPLSLKQDKLEEFCETYKGFIDVADAHTRFDGHWKCLCLLEREKAAGATGQGKRRIPLLLSALLKSFYADLLKAFFSKLAWSVLVIFAIWFFIFNILDFIKLKSKGLATPTTLHYQEFLCAGLFVTMSALSVGIQQMGIYSSILGAKVKAALTTAIFKKIIVRDAYGSKSDVVSLIAKDVEKLAEACSSLQFLWSGIAETMAVFAVVLSLMGSAILPGVGLMLVFLPFQYYLGMKVAYQKKSMALVSNKRITLMEEIMRGIKLIKMYGWEASFFKNLTNIRKEEGDLLVSINRIKATILGLIFCLPPMLSLAIFATQEATGEIESVLVFTVLSFFNTLRVPFSKLPKSLRDVLDAFSCMERIQAFLLEPDLAEAEDPDLDVPNNKKNVGPSSHQGIVFHNVSVSYGQGGKIALSKINLNIPQGSLMMVAGSIASGKSTLLKSILSDLTVREGTCFVSHSKAYVPQTPWTALGTVRENILFGLPFDDAFYRKVLHVCALEPDLKIMPDGDMTWIGERGGNLSGGQKQRIALARAAYSRADLYVLDSPLSAVDMYSCQHIFKFCIQDLMIGGGGTVVLATHQTELFSMSDHLVVMKGGKIAYNDKYTYSGIKHLFPNFGGDGEAGESVQSKKTVPKRTPVLVEPEKSTKNSKDASGGLMSPGMKPGSTEGKEDKQSIYKWYINKIGVSLFMLTTLVFICGQIQRVYSDVWISIWSQRKYADRGRTEDIFYTGIYAVLVFAFLCFSFARCYLWFSVGKRAANKIHDLSFEATLKAPMHFFHVTPIGNLLAIFSKDIDVIDDMLVDNSLMLQIFFWILILALSVVTYNLPLFLAIVAGLAVAYIYIVHVFIRTSVPLKKAAGQSVNQVVAHTAETLSGLAIVRAFHKEDYFLAENLKFQGRATVTNFSLANLSLWLAFRVDLVGSLLVLACCLLALLDDTMDAAIAGLIVSNSFQILLFFSIMSRTMGEVHDNMSSVEQARRLTKLEAEHEPIEETELPANWPCNGEIKFEGVVMPYLPFMPPVLKGISFSIRQGEKVGVVGRTGAGKSSLIVALFRLAEICEGKIEVDSIDCSGVSLNKLRRSMAIIPQEPVMFGGTLRSNLDPFNEHPDKALLDVLHKCLLGPMVDADPAGLEAKVETMGSNYSLGTQQLICLARAMLNPSRILLMDEATAALDSDTNAAVQKVLKAHFSDRTIFTIAHRLDTIIDSDRILVMNAGVVAEFDRPVVLLENPESIFYELCMNTGKAQFDVLVAKARAHGLSG
jgi:ATP-binding cassette, subfamily C (CFTR/MRP), member 1